MAPKHYRISDNDLLPAHRWLDRKLRTTPSFPNEEQAQARSAYYAVRTPDELQSWCERYLDQKQWTQMRNAIRASHQRARRPKRKGINISPEAYQALVDYAKAENVTLSEAIVRLVQT
jgi:macrodomain Ter protein organizer (MatP/YcbG family)